MTTINAYYLSAGSDLNQDFLGSPGVNTGDYIISDGSGIAQNGPDSASTTWALRSMVFNSGIPTSAGAVYTGFQTLERPDGRWERTVSRAFSNGAMSCGPWIRVPFAGEWCVSG